MSMQISDYFSGVAAKVLSEVDINELKSNQHELGTTKAVRGFLGEPSEAVYLSTRLVFVDDDTDPVVTEATVTYYDVRHKDPTRGPEYRLYYPTNEVTDVVARPGDSLILAKTTAGDLLLVFARRESTIESQIQWLFALDACGTKSFAAASAGSIQQQITPRNVEILFDAFGIEPEIDEPDYLDILLKEFGTEFPSTMTFSAFARELVDDVNPLDDPDGALLRWWDMEYLLFRTLERHMVAITLEDGFHGDSAVDNFLKFSLGVQNRGKSRSGHAFENHLGEIFDLHQVRHTRVGRTERGAKPDFLFPSQSAYDDLSSPVSGLRMLGAKTTAKDRWRQVLAEADRISVKHLVTMQPAISSQQTDEMDALSVELVIPAAIHSSYSMHQQTSLWTLSDFVNDVKATQV